jgi:hypothetical protein
VIDAEKPSVFLQCVERAMTFEPSLEMKHRLEKNRETFTQYVVRLLSYSCKTCGALPGAPCSFRTALSKSCGTQFHRSRARAARCPVTKNFYEPELDDG